MCTLSSYLLQHLYEVRALHLHFVNMRGNIKHYIDWYHTKSPYTLYIKVFYNNDSYQFHHLREFFCTLFLFIKTMNNDIVNRRHIMETVNKFMFTDMSLNYRNGRRFHFATKMK